MQLHHALRELVDTHGRSILDDAADFRGVLDDVLTEDQASTGDINLLVDAVRFDALGPLRAMIEGGAEPGRAVDEAGLRLARNRGGDDRAAASWAAAVLGYAVAVVPDAVVVRHRSARPSAGHGAPTSAPPTRAPLGSPTPPPPPSASPPAHFPHPPVASPPAAWSPSGPGAPPYAPHQPHPGLGGHPPPTTFMAAPVRRRRSPMVWVAAAVAGVVVVGGGVTAALLTGDGGGGGGGGGDDSTASPPTAEVDVSPAAIDERYDALASAITSGATGCEALVPGTGQTEVVECDVSTGTLRLVTFEDEASLTTARGSRLDYRAGTLTSDVGTTALYQFDPERGGSSDPAVVYWDSTAGLQSATLTGAGSAKVDTLITVFDATAPRVSAPTAPEHPDLREFIDINMDVASCTRQRTFFAGETEESACEVGVEGIVVSVGRYATRKAMKDDRNYYKSQYDEATTRGDGPDWTFGDGPKEGAYFAYLDDTGETATVYWDWDSGECHCYGVAWSFDGDLQRLEDWWPSEG